MIEDNSFITPNTKTEDTTTSSVNNNVAESGNSFDWKNSGFGTDERLSRRINEQEASKYRAKRDKKTNVILSAEIRQMLKKRGENYNEPDEGGIDQDVLKSLRELQEMQSEFSNGDTSLLDSLSSTEKRNLSQNNILETSRRQQDAGRMNALFQADVLQKDAGLKKMSTSDMANKMQDAVYNPRRTARLALEVSAEQQLGITGKIGRHDEKKVARGLKNIAKVTEERKTKNVTINDVKKVSGRNTPQNKTAEMLLIKSGQTARLAEIRMKKSINHASGEKSENTKATSKQMKELVKETLPKNDKNR